MGLFRQDPGPCPICGAAHTACTGATREIRVSMVPGRDAREQVAPPPLRAEVIQEALPEGSFTTGTYRGKKKKAS